MGYSTLAGACVSYFGENYKSIASTATINEDNNQDTKVTLTYEGGKALPS